MVPSLLIKTLASLCIFVVAIQKKSKWINWTLGLIVGLLYLSALLTYEFAFLLFPCFILSYLYVKLDSRETSLFKTLQNCLRFPPLLTVTIIWVSYFVFIFFFLRPNAVAISGAYVLGVSSASISTFFTQLLSPLPITNLQSSFEIPAQIIDFLVYLVALLFALTYKFLFIEKRGRRFLVKSEHFGLKDGLARVVTMILISLTLWATPAMMLSVQPIWWSKSNLQTPYLGVMVQEFGIAIFFATAINMYFGGRNVVQLNKRVK